MIDADEKPAPAAGEAARGRHLEDDLRGLVDSGLGYVKAEVGLQRARAGYAAGRIRSIALLGVVALLLVFFALVALTVGMVFALTPLIGAIWATLLVFGVLVLGAVVAGLMAARQWKQMTAALSNPGAEG